MVTKICLCLYEIMIQIDLCEHKYPYCNKLACKRGNERSGSLKCREILDDLRTG
jgi:hypothetical protein